MKWLPVSDGFISDCDVYQIIRVKYEGENQPSYHCYHRKNNRSKFIGFKTSPELAQINCESDAVKRAK